MLRHWRNILRAAQTRPITSPPWFIIGIFSIIYLGSLWCCFCLGSYLSTEDYSTVHKVFILIHNEWLLLGSYLISNKYVFDLFILIFSLYIMNSIIHLCECCIYVLFIIFCVNVYFVNMYEYIWYIILIRIRVSIYHFSRIRIQTWIKTSLSMGVKL